MNKVGVSPADKLDERTRVFWLIIYSTNKNIFIDHLQQGKSLVKI